LCRDKQTYHTSHRPRALNAIAHSGRYVALNPAEIECFMSLQLDNDKYEYTIRFIELAIQCRHSREWTTQMFVVYVTM
jgi:hypothetical protein